MSDQDQVPGLAHVAGASITAEEALAAVRAWIAQHVPAGWRAAAEDGGPAAVRGVRTAAEYRAWSRRGGTSPTAGWGGRARWRWRSSN